MEVKIRHNPLVRIARAFERLWARIFGFDIFISYAREDGSDIAKELHEELARNYIVFIDESAIEHGEPFWWRIERELLRTRLLVVVLSEKALDSPGVEREVRTFFNREKRRPAVPVFAPPVEPRDLECRPEPWQRLATFHGLVLPAPPSSTADLALPQEQGRIALDEVNSLFEGKRQRVKARRALAASLLSFLAITVWGIARAHRAELDNKINQWVADAERAADAGRFDQAEWAYANAWWQSNRSREELEELYLHARGRRYLEPLDFSVDPNEIALAVSTHANSFFLVSQAPESSTIHLRTLDRSSTLELEDPEDLFQVSLVGGWLLLQTLDRLWIQPADLETNGEWLEDMEDLVDVTVGESTLHLLFRNERKLVLRSCSLPLASEETRSSYELPSNSVIMTSRVLENGTLFVAGDESEPDGGWVPTAWVRAPEDEDWTAHPAPRELSLAPQCFRAYVSAHCKIACLSLSPIDFSDNAATKPARNLYMRLDDDFMLSWLAHSGHWTPKLFEPGPIDIVFTTENGDLKWLEQPSVVLTQVEPTTLASHVSSFLAWPREGDELPTVAAAREDGRMDILVGGDLWSSYPLPLGPAHLVASEDYSIIAVNTLNGIQLFRQAGPFEPSVPRLESLSSELRLNTDKD